LNRGVARGFGTVFFEMEVKKGKLIENFSKYDGIFNRSEFEVVLRKSSQLLITGVEEEKNYTIITAKEL
jgi:hypothetical protein